MATIKFESRIDKATGDAYTISLNTVTDTLSYQKVTAAGVVTDNDLIVSAVTV